MSTPLDRIPNDPNKAVDEDTEAVQAILREFKNQESADKAGAYAPEPVEYEQEPAPPQQYHREGPPQQYEEYERTAPPPRPTKAAPPTLTQRLVQEAKEPLLVLVLCLLFGVPAVNALLLKWIPRIASEAGGMNMFGVLMKATLITIAFYLAKKLVVK